MVSNQNFAQRHHHFDVGVKRVKFKDFSRRFLPLEILNVLELGRDLAEKPGFLRKNRFEVFVFRAHRQTNEANNLEKERLNQVKVHVTQDQLVEFVVIRIKKHRQLQGIAVCKFGVVCKGESNWEVLCLDAIELIIDCKQRDDLLVEMVREPWTVYCREL